jgi:capsular polysaccharide biosynthesis protein
MAGTAETLTGLLRRWRLAGLLTVLGAVAGLGYTLVSQPVYAAKAYVAVVAQNPSDTTAVSYAQAYARIAGQGEALSVAASASNGAVSVSELRHYVRASSSPDAPVIEVTGTAGSASRAADLANLMARGLVSTANRHSADTRMKLFVVSAATSPADPTSPQPPLDIAVGAAVGLMIGWLAVLAGAGRAGPNASQDLPASVRGATPAGAATRSNLPRWTERAPAAGHASPAVLGRWEGAGPYDSRDSRASR